MAVGKAVGVIKANTSKRMEEKFPFLRKVYWGTDGIWSDGYFVSTVGVNEEVIRALHRTSRPEVFGTSAA